MAKYELTFLLSEDKEIKNIKALIQDISGKLVKEESWGEKTLSYPIKKKEKALFYNWTLELDQKRISELKRKFNFHEKLLRYLLLKAD